ncbi:Macrophage mannose receptor 1 [Liparis tanakae]|uniref:Macrophage mannose receptor 1 n=1 Tax=Liparis tanakae TaxID=230148 RepID=A0A4Z2GSZ7_9TELE|nr:Macrophage mannose receptor 1 [Liparis tanakae]
MRGGEEKRRGGGDDERMRGGEEERGSGGEEKRRRRGGGESLHRRVNPGFEEQLCVYEALQCEVDTSSPLYKQYRLTKITEKYPGEAGARCKTQRLPAYSSSPPLCVFIAPLLSLHLRRVLLLLGASAAFAKYVHIPEKKTWPEAQEHCRRVHTDLAPVSSANDTERLRLLTGDSSEFMWFGLQRSSANRSEWTWSGGGGVSTFFWAESEPDNAVYKNYGVMRNYESHGTYATHLKTFFCYRAVVVRERKTWEEALEHCRERHRDLASVASDTEMSLIQRELSEDETTARLWIGLRFFPGGWLWVDGQPLAHEAWGGEGKAECPEVKRRCAALRVTGGTRRRAGPTTTTTTHRLRGSEVDAHNLLGVQSKRDATAAVEVQNWEAHDCVESLHFICY